MAKGISIPTAIEVERNIAQKALMARAEAIDKDLRSGDKDKAAAAFKGPWQDYLKDFQNFASKYDVKLVEREIDTPTVAGATVRSYESCLGYFNTGQTNSLGQFERCHLKRQRRKFNGEMRCVYDCGYLWPAV